MRIFAILALVLGIFLAGGAVKYMYGQFRDMEARFNTRPEAEPIPTVMIAVAKEELRFGKRIGKDSVRLVEWPADAAPENAFNTIEELFKEDGLQRTVLRQMEVNEAVLKSKITGFGEEATVAALLSKGMRAHTLGVDAKSSVAGFLFPGSRVDIYLSYKNSTGTHAKLLMERAEIIAVDQTTDTAQINARVARTVTLEVTPRDSRRLILAEQVGQLSFNLRGIEEGPEDAIESDMLDEDLSVAELLNIQIDAPEEEEVKGTVIVRRGGRLGEAIEVEDEVEAKEETTSN